MLPLELWAGAECTVNRVGDRYFDQLQRTGHADRLEDLTLLAELGVKAVRYPVLWERTSPSLCQDYGSNEQWAWADERLTRLRDLGIRVIVGLVHHGSGPPCTSLLEDSFVRGLESFADALARRYPWIEDFTPVNEPLTTARFSGLYGHWYPHHANAGSFLRMLMIQTRATSAAMGAIRRHTPRARLVQTEDMGVTRSTPLLQYQARHENERRMLSLDLLCGMVDNAHPLYDYMVEHGVSPRDLRHLAEEPCAPDLIGVNYYVTSDRFLDHRIHDYPVELWGGNGRHRYVDVEAVRVPGAGLDGHEALLKRVWKRYRRPIAVTETHLGGHPEDRVRWLEEAWTGALAARAAGADVRAVTLWSAFGAYDWDCLVTQDRGRHEVGVFDMRAQRPRKTSVALLAEQLATQSAVDHPLAGAPGWWRRVERVVYEAHKKAAPGSNRLSLALPRPSPRKDARQEPVGVRRASPILITGAHGKLGRALVGACEERQLEVRACGRAELDITDRGALDRLLREVRPWIVINAAGFACVHAAEDRKPECHRTNVFGSAELAQACSEHAIRLVLFSSAHVFNGLKDAPYLESDLVAPCNYLGETQALGEARARAALPSCLIIRAGAMLDAYPDAGNLLRALHVSHKNDDVIEVANDRQLSIAMIPQLVHACLDLAIDHVEGIAHLANEGMVTPALIARHLWPGRVVERPFEELAIRTSIPARAGLGSGVVPMLPHCDEVLSRWSASALPALSARSFAAGLRPAV